MRPKLLIALAATFCVAPALLLRAQGGKESPHGALKLDCGQCHTPEKWAPVTKPTAFRHQTTGFALEGPHARASCAACHRSLEFNLVGTACVDCHKDPHRGELGTRCEDCHVPGTWSNQRDVARAHVRTRFPLLAAHASLDCAACHRDQRPFEYVTTPTDCGTCHALTYDQTTSPNHAQAGFPRHCEGCHGIAARSWLGASFTHESFPLRGAHARLDCARCHRSGYVGTPRDCVGCHRSDYQGTSDPNHVAAGFPTSCESCHGLDAWRPAAFDHNRTRFPLTGAHQSATCGQCHPGGRYADTPTDCYSCHQTNYNGATDPNHQAGHFPTTCEACHSTAAWQPANFDHAKTSFPLTGAHQSVACARCHVGGTYAGTPTDCYACHASNYNATSNPNHQASGFPTDCKACHTTAGWTPASFNHDGPFFPIYSGRHKGVWSTCADCHVSPGNYKQFECILCHAHSNKAQLDSEHHDVGGYHYVSTACYACHPRGTHE